MIVEKDSRGLDEAWMVQPCPGYVLKFKDVNLSSVLFPDKNTCKLFLNVCHCEELPAPIDDLEEDEVAKILDSDDPSRYKIPLCVGEIDCVRDNKDENSAKIDVVVNSMFFKKRMEKSEFFRQLFLLVASEAIKTKHDINIEIKDAIRLRNRKVIGEISAQRIRKRPEKPIIEEVASESGDNLVTGFVEHSATCNDKDCLIVLHGSEKLEINYRLSQTFENLDSLKRLHVKVNDDRVLIHDHFHTIADFYVPFKMKFQEARLVCSMREKMLKITVPVIC